MDNDNDTITTMQETQTFKNPSEPTGIGARLKSAREAMNLTEKEAASRLHLSSRFIDIMENEDFASGPPMTFMRGYLRSYARILNIPSKEVDSAIEALGMSTPSQISTTPPLAWKNTRPSSFNLDPYIRWGSYLVFFTLVILLGIWWNSRSTENETTKAAPVVKKTSTEITAPQPMPATMSAPAPQAPMAQPQPAPTMTMPQAPNGTAGTMPPATAAPVYPQGTTQANVPMPPQPTGMPVQQVAPGNLPNPGNVPNAPNIPNQPNIPNSPNTPNPSSIDTTPAQPMGSIPPYATGSPMINNGAQPMVNPNTGLYPEQPIKNRPVHTKMHVSEPGLF